MVQIETLRPHFVAEGDLVVWDGRWQVVGLKKGPAPDGTYAMIFRDVGGVETKRRVQGKTAIRTLASPFVPKEVRAQYLLGGGGL